MSPTDIVLSTAAVLLCLTALVACALVRVGKRYDAQLGKDHE